MTKLEDLPLFWRREIRLLRAENARLRIRSRESALRLEDVEAELAATRVAK